MSEYFISRLNALPDTEAMLHSSSGSPSAEIIVHVSPAPETAFRASDAPTLAPLHRLSSAYSMLASRRGRSILQVAFDCGFADISTFNRAFRKGSMAQRLRTSNSVGAAADVARFLRVCRCRKPLDSLGDMLRCKTFIRA
ncbi:AraC family transcriptional regulator [Tianweitania sp. Rool2]|uniref:AraC family transcriptional regulator n=1 Tax=Oryzicola mucosus TaxID=2767425 RepID=A0A8J6PTE8_9HYPH|nr:AraC family transcriptional regulator [Oryzicola mucosus]